MAWLALAKVRGWIDARHGIAARLAAGWNDLDVILAEALKGGDIKAKGRDGGAVLPVVIGSGAEVLVQTLLGEVRVTTTKAAVGHLGPRRESREYRYVDVEEEPFGVWCARYLGEPVQNERTAAALATTERPSARSRPQREPVRAAIEEIHGEFWPVAPFDKETVDAILGALRARGWTGVVSTIRRALKDGR